VGDGWPCADRSHASFLYRLGRTALLVDCGEGASGRFKATGLPYDLVDGVFLSHLHADHFAGLFMLLQGFWLEQRHKELPVYLPADGVKPLGQMLNAAYLYPEVMPFGLRLAALKAAKPAVVGDARVTPFRTSHLDRLRKANRKKYPGDYDAFCFLIEAPGLRIGHSADLGRPEDLAPLVRQPLDLLVCELAHFRAEEIFQYLDGRNIKRVIFTHVARPYWRDLKNTRLLAAKMLPRLPFAFARDGDEFGLSEPAAT
jgi:ribonuclease Z